MKTIVGLAEKFRKRVGVLALAAALAAGMLSMSVTSYAESAAKTLTTAKIRQQPTTSSEVIASVESDKTISVTGQTTSSDGYTWYQVYVDANTLGYIRSDLVTITDGSTPATVDATASTTTTTTTTGGSTATTSTADETVVDVTAVNPVSASVSGSSPVRVRQNASTTSRIYATVEGGSALTVTGTATGTDGNQWYQVNFISAGSEVNGFIRADYVTLGGELTEATTDTGETGTETDTETAGETTEETKDWETYQSEDGTWHLQNNTDGNIYSITDIFKNVTDNAQIATDALKAKNTLQTVVIILVVIMVAMVAAIGYLIFRLKDMKDSAYYREVEQETMRRRAGSKQQTGHQTAGGGQKAARAGTQAQQTTKASEANGQRKAAAQGQTKSASAADGQRKAAAQGQTKSASSADGQRAAAGTGGQAAGQNRPKSAQAAGQSRPKSASAADGQRAAAGTGSQAAGQKPAGSAAQPANAGTTGQKTPAAKEKTQPAWKSKNFVADDDEFEFEFLNWDGEEE